MRNKYHKINVGIRSYIYCAMVFKFVLIIKCAIEFKSFSFLLAELFAFSIALLSPLSDYFITKELKDEE